MRCKLNDIAYIKKSLRPVNVGLIVTCKELLGYFIEGEDFLWNGERQVAHTTDFFWVVECQSGIETLYGKSKQAMCPDSWLIPIRADGLEKELVTETEFEETDGLHV